MKRFFIILLTAAFLASLTGCAFLPTDSLRPTSDGSDTIVIHTDSDSDRTGSSAAPTDSDGIDSGNTDGAPEDILRTPVSNLSADGRKALADYLFETYIPCSYGIFADAKTLSSPAVWSSVEALNRAVDHDESAESRTLAKVLEKVAVYYPDTPFDPEKVRVYDKATRTFAPSPANEYEYILLSYEVKDGQITIFYEDKPDVNDPDAEPVQYATTLKNSATEGYFTFVSSVKTDAVG